MPRLEWDGKKAVENYHLQVPYHVLREETELSAGGADGAGNLLVQGDNLVALKALLPYYRGQVKCIYIDPPYNTGNEGWVYNDNVNSPIIKEWFKKVVGKEAEDFSRHDKWLCMMYPRLRLLREFLKEDGVILISLDETEIAGLRLLLDEVFGKSNRLGSIVWNTRNTDNRIKTNLSPDHEYIMVYGKNPQSKIEGRIIDRSDFKNLDNDPRGPYVTDPLTGKATAEQRPNLHAYNMAQPGTSNIWKPDPAYGWITDEAGYNELLKENRIWWPPNPRTGKPRKKRFLSEAKVRMPASTFWTEFKTQSGANDLDNILGERVFAFPKPVQLIKRVIDYCAPEDSIVLDSFGGSGTTAEAIWKQNAEDKGNRKFILVEMEREIARNITAERLRRVSLGYTGQDGKLVPGLGGGFRFLTLGEPIFNADGTINPAIAFPQLARHVWFEETREPLPADAVLNSPFLGVSRVGVGVYLLFNGILKDRRINGGNILTLRLLATLPPHDGPKVIYAAGCRLDAARLREEGITFKQTPYQITGAAASADALTERTEEGAL